MRPRCPQCGGQPGYEEGGNYVCMMGGHRWPMNGNPIIIYKGKDNIMSVKKICRNCEREKAILGDGLCGACYFSARKFEKGTPEYNKALLDTKERLSNPDAKPRRPRKLAGIKPIPPDQIKEIKTRVNTLKLKHNGVDPAMAHVISTLQLERLSLLAKADKITQALELLSA